MDNNDTITFIGLGTMGMALVERQLAAGARLVVWNRSADRAGLAIELGARFEPDAASAVGASGLVVVCVTDAAATREVLLDQDDVAQALTGRHVVTLTSMSTTDARALAKEINSQNGDCLCGMINGYPSNVNEGDCTIALSGSKVTFDSYRPVLESLGGRAAFVAEDPAAAARFSQAVFAAHYGNVVAFMQGAAMIKAAGFDLSLYASEAHAGQLDLADYAEQIATGEFPADEATLDIEAAAYADVPDGMRELGLETALADALHGTFQRALNLGYGHEGIAALTKVFSRPH